MFGKKYKYRAQDPITLPNESEPEPDLAIVDRQPCTKKTGHPGPDDIHLIVEVAQQSLSKDQTTKAHAYALAGLREYWIINLRDRQVELHLEPNRKTGRYGAVTHHPAGTTFASPLCGGVEVDALLPEPAEEE